MDDSKILQVSKVFNRTAVTQGAHHVII